MDHELAIKAFGTGSTNMAPAALFLTLLVIAMILILPKGKAIYAFMGSLLLIPVGQSIYLISFNVYTYRMLLAALFLRYVIGSEARKVEWNTIDKLYFAFVAATAVARLVLWRDVGMVINTAGFLFDSALSYLTIRYFVCDVHASVSIIRGASVCALIIMLIMVVESRSGINPLEFMGARAMDQSRDGGIRAQASLAHPIMAGAFGASMVPLCAGVWFLTRERMALYGAVCGVLITFMSRSSGPMIMLFAATVGLAGWRLRDRMRLIRWASALGILLLHLVMKAPVWALIGRVSVFGSSTGYHRVMVIDHAIRHFWEWWLVGTKYTSSWTASGGYDFLWDIQNGYVDAGVSGGVLALALLVGIFVKGFSALGEVRRGWASDNRLQLYAWCLGSWLFAHLVGFLGIVLFGQTIIMWNMLLAVIAALLEVVRREARANGPSVGRLTRAT